jgi:CHAT domain-containing protein
MREVDFTSALGDDQTAIIVLFQGFKKTLAFVVSGTTINGVELPNCDILKTRQLGEKWLSNYAEFRKHRNNARKKALLLSCMDEVLSELYMVVFEPIRQTLSSNIRKLIFIPHLWLHYFPFHAMHHEVQGFRRYLIDEYDEVSYAPNLSILIECRKRKRDQLMRFVAIENPTDDLPESEVEVAQVLTLFNDHTLIGPKHPIAASADAIVRETHDANIVLCTGHAVGGDPDSAHLVLSNGERFQLLDQLVRLDLPLCALWDADTCESAFPTVAFADNWLTLAAAPLYAGARTVWSTMWVIDDTAARVLKQMAYENLLHGRMNKVLALNEAQRQFIKTCRESTSVTSPLGRRASIFAELEHPFYWASYMAAGAD